MVALLRHDLGAGESEAIVLAREVHADFLLIDERLGRSAARGLLDDARAIVEQLHHYAGFWLSSELRKLITG